MPHRILSCLREFYEKFDQPMMDRPRLIEEERRRLRMRLLEEAYHEYRYAERGEDLVKIAESLGAMLYVIGGTSLEYGIPLDTLFLEIHRSNLSKIGSDGKAITRDDGKVMKGPNYTKPDIAKVICDAMYPEEDEDLQCSKTVLTK